MAIGLTDHLWNYREYVWLPVHADPILSKQMDERIARLLTPALQDQPRGRTQAPPPVEVREEHEQEAASLPKPTVSPLLTPIASRNLLLYQSLPISILYRYALGRRRKDDPGVGAALGRVPELCG
jgi:hypothetical protein